MIKRKGQIIPRRIISAMSKRYQHLITFGCDVEIDGNNVTAINGGAMLYYTNRKYVRRPSKTTIIKGVVFNRDVVFRGFDYVVRCDNGVRNQKFYGGEMAKGKLTC